MIGSINRLIKPHSIIEHNTDEPHLQTYRHSNVTPWYLPQKAHPETLQLQNSLQNQKHQGSDEM